MTTTYTVPGFDAAGIAAGIKKSGAPDLTLIASRTPCRAAATFTTNKFPAAPVTYDQQVLSLNPEGIHAVIINSGCANACTGVIGVQLPMEKLLAGAPKVVDALRPDGWEDASRAIMTTDTIPKAVSRQVQIGGKTITLTGISKGAGMIKPNMATMLGFLATDADVAQPVLDALLKEVADLSFNSITVDGDTSTNDSYILIATGQAGNATIADTASADYAAFRQAVLDVSILLAQAIVRDGEGATKFITLQIEGGKTREECRKVGYAIGHSPLVKTAFFASDPYLGRILAAIGYAGIDDLDVLQLRVWLGSNGEEVLVAEKGGRAGHPVELRLLVRLLEDQRRLSFLSIGAVGTCVRRSGAGRPRSEAGSPSATARLTRVRFRGSPPGLH